MSKNPSLRRTRESVWDVLLDGLSCWLLAVGVILAFDQLYRFHASLPAIVLHPLLVLGVLLLFHRRMWLLPALLAAGALLTAAVLHGTGTLEAVLEYLSGLFNWWVTLFPRRSPFNTPENIRLVQWLVHIAISCVVYALVRLTHSAALLAAASGLLFAIILFNGFHENIPAMALIAAGLLPLLARGVHPRRADPFHPTPLTPRHKLQAAGAAVAAAVCLIAALALPQNTFRWKWRPMNNVMTDLGSLLKLTGDNGDLYQMLTLHSIGLQPNADRLGGNIRLDNYTGVLQVKTNAPHLMKGRVYDVYTGSGWQAEDEEAYRFGSTMYDAEYRRAFDIEKPSGGAAAALWQSLAVPARTEVLLLQPNSSLYSCGRVRGLSLLNEKNEVPLFNGRSELFVRAMLPRSTRYTFDSDVADRSASSFKERFTRLEREAALTEDRYYSSIQYRYTRYPGTLSPTVAELADTVTRSAETPYEKMERLEQYLQRHYTYTLTPGDVPANRDFVEYFLETKTGYCVYFASAMTIMARTLGVPARFVVGYGLDSQEGDTWVALQKNAHAWVECYFYGIGWLTFDPTAGSGYTRLPMSGGPAAANPSRNSGANTSQEREDTPPATTVPPEPAVTGSGGPTETDASMTPEDNPTAASASRTAGGNVPMPGYRFRLPLWGILLLAGAAAALAAALWLLIRIQRFQTAYRLERVRQRFPSLDQQAAYYYRDVLRQLAYLGVPLQPGETPLQYLERLGTQPLDKKTPLRPNPDLRPVLIRIVEWRYGETPLTPEHIESMAHVHEELEPLVRRRMKGRRYFWNRLIRHPKNA